MIVTKITIGVGVVLYFILLAISFSSPDFAELRNVLLVPLILVILVGAGNLMQGFMGIPGKSPKFRRPKDDDTE
jgi:NADH:ubiquinone oxidoreductase subunit 6 (subunit J)